MPSPAKFRSRARHATIFVRNLSIPTHRKKTFRNRQAFKHLHQPCNTFQTLSNPPAGIPASPKPFAGTFLGPKNTNNFRENTSGTHEPSDTSSTRNLPVPPEPSGTLFAAPEPFFFLRRRKNVHQHFVLSYFAVKTQSLWKIERWKGPSERSLNFSAPNFPQRHGLQSHQIASYRPTTTNCFPGFPRFDSSMVLNWYIACERWSLSPPKNLSNRWLSSLWNHGNGI